MSRISLKDVSAGHEPLDPDEGAQYAAAFGDLYWWGDPNNLPTVQQPQTIRASKHGKRMLRTIEDTNAGMVRMGDPVLITETMVTPSMKQIRAGAVVKLTCEYLVRQDGFGNNPSTGDFRAKHDRNGFSITETRGDKAAVYAYFSIATAVARCRNGSLAFFGLGVDDENSFGYAPGEDRNASIKLFGVHHKAGHPSLPIGQTLINKHWAYVEYTRARRAAIYHPDNVQAMGDLEDLFKRFMTS